MIDNQKESMEVRKQVKQLDLHDMKMSVQKNRLNPESDEEEDNLGRSIPSKKKKSNEDDSSKEEVNELAGYLDELYLPRDAVSADVALMADLMYT
jgi:hypothetical protein